MGHGRCFVGKSKPWNLRQRPGRGKPAKIKVVGSFAFSGVQPLYFAGFGMKLRDAGIAILYGFSKMKTIAMFEVVIIPSLGSKVTPGELVTKVTE
jgi:hypothetical protein